MVEVPCKLQWFGQISQRYMFFNCYVPFRGKDTQPEDLCSHLDISKNCPTFTGPCAALRVVVLEKRQGSNGTEDLWVADAWPSLKGSRNEKLHVSNEREKPGWLLDIGDEILSSFVGSIISQSKRSILTNQYNWNVARVFDHCSCGL